MREVGVALVGSGFISLQYAAALARIDGARVAAVASRGEERAAALSARCGDCLATTFADLGPLLAAPDVDVVCVNSPNRLHAEHAIAAARAGKHVIVEKPLCLRPGEADAMIAAASEAGVGLGYAENLCFTPAYVEAKRIVASGRLGEVLWARQSEKHAGPYSPWFFEPEQAGGGALADMGCHGIECLRHVLGKPPVVAVRGALATLRHDTPLDDEARVDLRFEGGLEATSESSWVLQGGMESVLEVHGREGTLRVDLLGQTGLELFRPGEGWTRPQVDPLVANGYVGELEHFLACFASGETPEESGEDGRAVLEILRAAYASAGAGGGWVSLGSDERPDALPVWLWKERSG